MTRDDVTLVIIETEHHALATRTLENWMEHIPFKHVLTFSDRQLHRSIKNVPIQPITSEKDRADLLVKTLWPFVGTSHALIIRWDSALRDQSQWSNSFMSYDYVGTSKPWRVSGAGISLQSSRLIQAMRFPAIQPVMSNADVSNDNHMDITFQDALETKFGIKFAPSNLNSQFCVEDATTSNSLAASGFWNIVQFLPKASVDFYVANRPAGLFDNYHTAHHVIVAMANTNRLDLVELCINDIKQCSDYTKLLQWLELDNYSNKSNILSILA
jgi:hypothetical protein